MVITWSGFQTSIFWNIQCWRCGLQSVLSIMACCSKEWKIRERHQQWPRKELIHDICNSGFEVVQIHSKITLAPDADFEWWLAFRSAETKYVRSFNMCQRDCFIALKILAKEYVESKFPDEDFLSSYIFKTLMFWSIKERDHSCGNKKICHIEGMDLEWFLSKLLCRCRWTYVAKLKKMYPGNIESGTYNYNLYNCSLCRICV